MTEPGTRIWFDQERAGRLVEADGGAEVAGTNYGARDSFEGTLTGWCMQYSDLPWRFVELGDLTAKPDTMDADRVWCDESYVFERTPGR